MNYTHPKSLVNLIELPLDEFVERAQPVKKKKSHPDFEPYEVLKNNPRLAKTAVIDCRDWFIEGKWERGGETAYNSWLKLAIQIFEAEDPDSYLKWKREIDYWSNYLSQVDQLSSIFHDMVYFFKSATGMGKKEIIKKMPSAHFCKRYNLLLRHAKQLTKEVEGEIEEVMWPPELPGVDRLRDEQSVSSANYIEIHIYCEQVQGLLDRLSRKIKRELDIVP